MRAPVYLIPLLLVSACGNSSELKLTEGKAELKGVMLPDRLLICTVGRALNLDPSRQQSIADVKYEGRYAFSLFLPSIPARQTAPPDPTMSPEPVHPGTRIVADPAALLKGVPSGFDRVVDIWPERVELARTIDEPLTQLIIVSDIDPAASKANLFMAKAQDAATFDLTQVYQGGCVVKSGAEARSHLQ